MVKTTTSFGTSEGVWKEAFRAFRLKQEKTLLDVPWKLNDRPKDTNRHDFAERQTSAWAEKNDSLGLHSARRQAGVPVGILGCNGGGYRQRRIPQPVSDFT